MSSQEPVSRARHNKPESHKNLKHDRDLPPSPSSRLVTSYHLISHRHVNVRSTSRRQSGPTFPERWGMRPLAPYCQVLDDQLRHVARHWPHLRPSLRPTEHRNRNCQNQGLNQPSDRADTDCAPRALVVERLSDCDHHRHQHPDACNRKDQARQARDDSQDSNQSGGTRKSDRSQQFPMIRSRLRLWQESRSNEVGQKGPDVPPNEGRDRTRDGSK